MVQVETIVHGIGGFVSAISIIVNPVLTVLLCLMFFTYEFTQYWEKEDWPTDECREFMIGFFCGSIVLIGVKIIGLI